MTLIDNDLLHDPEGAASLEQPDSVMRHSQEALHDNSVLLTKHVMAKRLQGCWNRTHLGSLVVHDLLGCQITLVSNKKLVDILIGIPVNLIQPLLHIVEALLVCDIVHNLQGAF